MSPAAPAVLLQHIRRLVGTSPDKQPSDRKLLRRFAGRGDRDAFKAHWTGANCLSR